MEPPFTRTAAASSPTSSVGPCRSRGRAARPAPLFLKKFFILKSMDSAINELKACYGKEECLRKAYGILSNRYRGHRGKTYAKLLHLFHTDIQKNWKKTG